MQTKTEHITSDAEAIPKPRSSPEQKIIEGAPLAEVLKGSEFDKLTHSQRIELIEHATVADFKQAIKVLHLIVAPNAPQEEHTRATEFRRNDTGELTGRAAEPEDREAILASSLSRAKALIQKYKQEGGDEDNLLDRCGALLAFGVTLTHYFEDGNGRTARTLGQLVHKGFDSDDSNSVMELTTLASPRDDTKPGGFKINSYNPVGDWYAGGKALAEPHAFLETIAAQEVPFDAQAYTSSMKGVYKTPRRVN